jgi:hypothetical protein
MLQDFRKIDLSCARLEAWSGPERVAMLRDAHAVKLAQTA